MPTNGLKNGESACYSCKDFKVIIGIEDTKGLSTIMVSSTLKFKY
jgi:hypothetical protein